MMNYKNYGAVYMEVCHRPIVGVGRMLYRIRDNWFALPDWAVPVVVEKWEQFAFPNHVFSESYNMFL